MNTKLIAIGMILLVSASAFGQKVDMTRMDRDLEVAKNVLQSLLGSENQYLMRSRTVEASYLEDYGVIFTLPDQRYYSVGRNVRIDRKGIGSNEVIVQSDEAPKSEKEEDSNYVKEAVTTFLIDYSDLIAQLAPAERIMVRSKGNEDIYISIIESGTTWSHQKGEESDFSAEILKKDISDYKQGKISREEVVSRIVYIENTAEEKPQDLELFSSIIGRLYSPDLSKTFFTDRGPRYERLKGFGVVFYMNTYSSYENDDFYRMPVLRRDDVDEDERNETVKELYPKFREDLKSVIVEYGRTMKSLEDDEIILIKVKTTRCDACGIPIYFEASVKKSVLTQFDQRKISLDEALKAVKIKESFKD